VNDLPRTSVLRLSLLGSTADVSVPAPDQLVALERAWARCLDETAAVPGDAATVAILANENDAGGHALLAQLTDEAAGAVPDGTVAFRASAVAGADGRVLGLFGVGRSTATTTLAADGFGYVTDQLLAVDRGGCVVALPGPLASGVPAVDGTQPPLRGPDELGLARADGALSLAHVVLLDRATEGHPAAVEPVDLLEALLGLATCLTHPWRLDQPLQRVCEVLEGSGGALRLVYEDPADAAALLDELGRTGRRDLPAEAVDAAAWRMGQPRSEQDRVLWALMDGRVRRAPYLDAVAIGDEAVVLVETPVRLSPLGVTIWEAAADAPNFDQLTAHVVEVHGAHPQAQALVSESVASMVTAGVLGFARPIPVERLITGVTARS
jgi:hypothetical protein